MHDFHYMTRTLIVAIACYGVVRLGIWLGAPDNFLAALWLSSGVGLFLMLCWGWRTMPAFFAGTVAALFTAPYPAISSFLMQCFIGLALIGQSWLIMRRCNLSGINSGNMGMLRAFGRAVVSGLVAPLLVVGVMLAFLGMQGEEGAKLMLQWWGWNILAIMLVLPFFCFVRLEGSVKNEKARFLLPVLVAVLAAIGFFKVAQTSELEAREAQFKARAGDIAIDIHRSIANYQFALDSVNLFYRASREIDHSEFHIFAQPLLERYPGMRSLAWVPRVHQDEREAFEAQSAKELGIEYGIWGFDSPFIEQGQRVYFPIRYVATVDKFLPVVKEEALGFDVASHPDRQKPLALAAKDGRQRASPPVRLVDSGALGFLIISPVYQSGLPVASEEERWVALKGVIIAVFQVDEVIDSVLQPDRLRYVNLKVRDIGLEKPIYQFTSGHSLNMSWQYQFALAGRTWELSLSPTYGFYQVPMWSPWVLVIGLLIACFMNFALIGILGRTAMVEAIVDQRTQELTRHQKALELAKQEAEQANRAKSSFLASLSHEIRTPLASIIGALDILKSMGLTDQQKPMVEVVHSSCAGLQELVSDVLDVARIESGKMELDSHVFNLHDLCREALSMTEALIGEKPVTIEMDIDADVPRQAQGDSLRLRQILMNLLGNAAKFTPEGTIRLSVELNGRSEDDCELLFLVEDTGIGIPRAKQENVFEKFSQAHVSREGNYGGSGLGLAICTELCRLMGGEIGVESSEGKGSRFWFTVQLTACAGSDAAEATGVPELTSIRFDGARILLAEDNVVNRRIISSIVRFFGAEVETASDGREAVEKIKSEGPFDIILMDCQMPGMDGIEATLSLRAMEIETPIIALTGNALVSDRERTLEAGMNDYLIKPVRRIDIARILKKWLPKGDGES